MLAQRAPGVARPLAGSVLAAGAAAVAGIKARRLEPAAAGLAHDRVRALLPGADSFTKASRFLGLCPQPAQADMRAPKRGSGFVKVFGCRPLTIGGARRAGP